MKKILYGCYGSNLNKSQMAYRCPDAKPVGLVYLEDYALVYDRVASIEKQKGAKVPIGLWEISKRDEKNLDIYEGFPTLYTKKIFTINNKEVMIYIKNNMHNYSVPSMDYFHTICQGYKDFNIDYSFIVESLLNNYKRGL